VARDDEGRADFVWTPPEGLDALPSVFLKAARAAERLL
jgi:A/G-specific adenine glycosylase